jgi:hypothetical protein
VIIKVILGHREGLLENLLKYQAHLWVDGFNKDEDGD